MPEVKNFFDELLSSIIACVNSLNEMGQAISEMSTIGVHGISVNGYSKGTVGAAFAEGTVGKAFAKGTGKYKGLPKAEKNALRSEYGQPELTVYPDGTTELTTEPTMSDLPKDTVIFNEEQTKRIMNNKGTIVGNAYKEGSADDGVIVTKDGSVLRPLREGDAFYEIMKKAQNYFEKQTNPIISPVMAIDKNVEAITKTPSSVNNVTNTQQAVNVGEVHIHCPGITKDEVAQQIGHELNRTLGGISLDARQRASITR